MGVAVWMICVALVTETAPETVLVTVNGSAITRGAVEVELLLRGIREPLTADLEGAIVPQLVERQLIRELLLKRNVQPAADEVAGHLVRVKKLLAASGPSAEELLKAKRVSNEQLTEIVRFPLMWRNYLRQVVTDAEIAAYFQAHKAELDGSQVRVRQILVKLPAKASEEDVAVATKKLLAIKSDVEAEKLSFAVAAEKFSEAPSKSDGGDVGWVGPVGQLPSAVSQGALVLPVNQISPPIRSAFGMHLVQVTDRKPGQLNQEDARPKIIELLGQPRWEELVARQKATAVITPAK